MPPTKAKTISAAEAARRKKQAAANHRPTPVKNGRGSGWRKGEQLGPQELTLPSGSTCLVLQPGLDSLIAAGTIDRMDILTALVDGKLVKPAQKGMKSTTVINRLNREELMGVMELSDRVTVAVCVDPPVELAPAPTCKICKWEGANISDHKPKDKHGLNVVPRDPNVFYTDGISARDKMAILQFAMGSADGVAPFPGESDASVASVAAVEDVEMPAE